MKLSSKFEAFNCQDIHHNECVFTAVVREDLVTKFGNISYSQQRSVIVEAFKRCLRKRKGKERKSVYCGLRMVDHKESSEGCSEELRQELQQMDTLHKNEVKKRKLAEHVANKYYKEWKAEHFEKDRALAIQVTKPVTWLPDSFFIPAEKLSFESDSNNDNVLGSGVFGTVKLCSYKGSYVAVKLLKHYETQTTTELRRALFHEAKILLNLRCNECIPTLLGVSIDKEPLKIVTQFNGIDNVSVTLHSMFNEEGSITLIDKQWHSLLNKLTKGIDHIHSCGYLHNDIKSDNVVVYKHKDEFIPVLDDFGKSCNPEKGNTKNLTSEEQIRYHLRYRHIAPEIINGSYKQSIYSDIYSFGYLVYKISTFLCPTSSCLKQIVKECYRVKTWSCRASLTKVSMILS